MTCQGVREGRLRAQLRYHNALELYYYGLTEISSGESVSMGSVASDSDYQCINVYRGSLGQEIEAEVSMIGELI